MGRCDPGLGGRLRRPDAPDGVSTFLLGPAGRGTGHGGSLTQGLTFGGTGTLKQIVLVEMEVGVRLLTKINFQGEQKRR